MIRDLMYKLKTPKKVRNEMQYLEDKVEMLSFERSQAKEMVSLLQSRLGFQGIENKELRAEIKDLKAYRDAQETDLKIIEEQRDDLLYTKDELEEQVKSLQTDLFYY